MGDLVLGYVIIALLAAGVALSTSWAARHLSPRGCTVAAAGVVGLLFVYIRGIWYDVRLAELLPFSNLIVVGNWLPLLTAALAGLAWQRTRDAVLRRGLVSLELALAGVLSAFFPLLGTVPDCGRDWDSLGTCLQTTKHSCSPAAAATLLKKYGIETTEAEMAELCLTRQGTTWQGLYRGLKLKTQQTPWDVRVTHCEADQLCRLGNGPLIISVGLDRASTHDTDFEREQGWIPGVSHSVVLERFTSNGAAVIADPSQEMTREHWDAETLQTLWRGYAFQLVPRR
jgi:hypothetical protein